MYKKNESTKKAARSKNEACQSSEQNCIRMVEGRSNDIVYRDLSFPSSPCSMSLHPVAERASLGLWQQAPLLTLDPARTKPKQPKLCLPMPVLLLCHPFRSTNSNFLLRLARGVWGKERKAWVLCTGGNNNVKNSIESAKLEWGRAQASKSRTRERNEKLLRDWRVSVDRGKD